jgi:hypothetical protein
MHSHKLLSAMATVAIAAILAGCGSSASSVSTGTYVKSICQAVGPWETDIQTRSSALDVSKITNASQGKTALQSFLSGAVADTDRALTQIKSAGTPNVSNGKQIQAAMVNAFTMLKSTLSQAATQAGSLPTSSPEAFKTAAQALGNNVRTSMGSIGSSLSGLNNADLQKAAAKEPACKSLGA